MDEGLGHRHRMPPVVHQFAPDGDAMNVAGGTVAGFTTRPDPRYAPCDGAYIAYQVLGDRPVDLLYRC